MQPEDVAIVGDEDHVARALEELAGIGVTDFNAYPLPLPEDREAIARTRAFLSARATASPQ
jgi:hypothetical protein